MISRASEFEQTSNDQENQMTNLQLQYHRKMQFSIYQQTKNHLFWRRTGYLSVSILRIIAYSIIALNMLKMQITMYLQKWVLHAIVNVAFWAKEPIIC